MYVIVFSLTAKELIRFAYLFFGRTFIAFCKVFKYLEHSSSFLIVCSSHLHLLTESSIAGEKNWTFQNGNVCEAASSVFLKIMRIKITKCKREQN